MKREDIIITAFLDKVIVETFTEDESIGPIEPLVMLNPATIMLKKFIKIRTTIAFAIVRVKKFNGIVKNLKNGLIIK